MDKLSVLCIVLLHSSLSTQSFDFGKLIQEGGRGPVIQSPSSSQDIQDEYAPSFIPNPAAKNLYNDPGLQAYSVTHSDTIYDMVPVYSCNTTDEGFSVSEWYGICKAQCSYSSDMRHTALSIFQYSQKIDYIPVMGVETFTITKKSHVSLLGTCMVYVESSVPTVLNISEFSPYLDQIIQLGEDPRKTAIEYQTMDDPECTYWEDIEVSGYKFIIYPDAWGVSSDLEGNLVVKNPYTGNYSSLSDNGVFYGSTWHLWNSSYAYMPHTCPLLLASVEDCLLNPLLGVYHCPDSGVLINTNGVIEKSGTCVGSVNISSNGIFYVEGNKSLSLAITGRVSTLIGSQNPSYTGITDLLTTISDTIGILEDTYCGTLCDLADRSFQQMIYEEDVVDTANGPWLPVQNGGIMRVVPCRVDTRHYFSIPLSYCANKNMFMIRNIDTGDTNWWNPVYSYFDKSDMCNISSINPYKQMMDQGSPIKFNFWRGEAVLYPPYTGPLQWTPRANPNSIRSSKWFPQIKNVSDSIGMTIDKLSDHIVFNVNKTSSQVSQNTPYSTVVTSPIVKILTKIWTDVQIIAGGIWSFLTGFTKWVYILVLTILVLYATRIFISFFRRTNDPGWM
ncbi:MAG: glycoprotein [Eggplant mottled dwarf alphanucleorhabdovirus]|nr:MAG: glycoprotein [Eggplant mottled dwarf alphanucleorhabdovirus]